MEGGLFGLSNFQKFYLYISQLMPTLIVLGFQDILTIFSVIQLFYLIVTIIYIHLASLQKSIHPYLFNQLGKMKNQWERGLGLSLSAFLLITIYGIILLKVGRVILPPSVDIGQNTHQHWFAFIIVILINPLLQQWYWRLFLPKTFQSTYYKSHLINVTYLLFHFSLFSKYLGFWRALPFVGSFFSVGRSMSHIKEKYGIIAAIITHYGITLAGFVLLAYVKFFTHMKV